MSPLQLCRVCHFGDLGGIFMPRLPCKSSGSSLKHCTCYAQLLLQSCCHYIRVATKSHGGDLAAPHRSPKRSRWSQPSIKLLKPSQAQPRPQHPSCRLPTLTVRRRHCSPYERVGEHECCSSSRFPGSFACSTAIYALIARTSARQPPSCKAQHDLGKKTGALQKMWHFASRSLCQEWPGDRSAADPGMAARHAG